MTRKAPSAPLVVLVGMLAPASVLAVQADHSHAAPAGHDHGSTIVDCTTLASPPWSGLSDADRARFSDVQRSVAGLTSPEAAMAAGFQPALGDIPGMGVHYVNALRTRDGVRPGEPDHLMFAPVDGRETLVGAAYAFVDVPDADEPVPFDSDLARWHDHPEFAPEGQTLHMLHVWFVPSSNGPFAGLNFWLPFQGAGLTPPSACWMSDPAAAERIQRVAFALVSPNSTIVRRIERARGVDVEEEEPVDRGAILGALDHAAREGDLEAWSAAADRFLESLTRRERARTAVLLEALTSAQMSSAEREALGGH